VDSTIRTVKRNLAEGAILVIVVLFLLLGNLRGACIAMLAIPLSMLIAAIGMRHQGISGNLMSLGAIDFGIIVDSAVIIVENCLRQLGERQHRLGRLLTRQERLHEVFAATRQMVQPAVFGQAIIITVYVPVLLLTGIEGKMFTPMGATVICALVGAFALSLTFIPAMVALLVTGRVAEHENAAMRAARGGYAPVIALALRWRWAVAGAAALLLAACAWLSTRLGSEFIPTLDEGDLAMHAMRIPSVGISQSTAMQLEVERAVRQVPEVRVVFSKTGTAEMASDPMPPNVSDTFIMFQPRERWADPTLTRDQLIGRVFDRVAALPGNNYEFSQPIQMRFNELISGVRSDVAVKVFGDRYEDLLPAAGRIAAILQGIPGASGVKVEQVQGLPSLSIALRLAVISRLGLDVAGVQDVIATAIGGRGAGMVFEGDRRFDIVVRLPEALRNDVAALRQLPIALPDAGAPPSFIPLGDVADLSFTEGTNQISRENGKRRIVVQANVRGRDLGSFVAEARRRIDGESLLPPGTWLIWGGQYENLQQAGARLLVVVPLCFAVIFILLFSAFASVKHAVLVSTGVPLALTGGIVALWLRGMPFSISAAVGFIALSGVAVLNGLVMVSCINHLRKRGLPLEEAIAQGSLTRLRPVLMTALVASLGFVPMALASGTGAEVQKPIATVVIGGIVSSTLLTLVVLPALYRLWHRADEMPEDDAEALDDRVTA
jgi:cobalt-zinc-cadmium resistance protein CzcA